MNKLTYNEKYIHWEVIEKGATYEHAYFVAGEERHLSIDGGDDFYMVREIDIAGLKQKSIAKFPKASTVIIYQSDNL